MELVFQENRLDYPAKIFSETVSMEQTADLIVPDSIADCDRIIDSFGTVLLRSEDCSDGSAAVSGYVQAGVLFVTEAGEVERLEAQIPFQVRRELPQTQSPCVMQTRCMLRGVDARALNSRKVLLRVGVSCTMTVYAEQTHICYDLSAPAPTLQLKRTVLPLRMPSALGEKTFPLNEELELPAGKNPIGRLLKCLCRLQIGEQKLVGSKAVFKGTAVVRVLYEDSDGGLCTHEWEVPFSQYVEMERELDDCELQTALALTALEAEPDGQLDSRRVFLSAELRAQCTAVGQRQVALIEDAYCTDGVLEPQWDAWSIGGVLDRQTLRETAILTSEQGAGAVIDAWVYADEPSRRRVGTTMELELPLSCNVLFTDAEGKPQGRTMRTAVTLHTEVAENGQCAMTDFGGGELFSAASAAGMELRVPLAVTVETTAEHSLRGMCGGTVETTAETGEKQPAVILRRTDRDEELWDIAKSLRISVDSIAAANGLQGTTVPADTMLLIPM